MKLYKPLVSMAVCSLLPLSPVAAQWLNYPSAGVPRTPDGKPNLSAPAPRTADGKPDLTGMWEVERNQPCPPNGCDDAQIPYEFTNIGWSLKHGLPYQPWAAALVKQRATENRLHDPRTHCLPEGMIRMHTAGFRKVIQILGQLVIMAEFNASYRQIYTDGRPLLADPNPSWNGYSTGKWDGDTLVVQTTGFRDDMWIDAGGDPLTSAAKVTERFSRVNFGNLEIELTEDDPKAYTKPWTVKLHYTIKLDSDILDYICMENEKDLPLRWTP